MIECAYCEGRICLRLPESENGCVVLESLSEALQTQFMCPTCFRAGELPIPVCDRYV